MLVSVLVKIMFLLDLQHLCFLVRMERILSANKIGSEVVSDQYTGINK